MRASRLVFATAILFATPFALAQDADEPKGPIFTPT